MYNEQLFYGHNAAHFSGLFDDIIKGVNAGVNVIKTLGGSGIAGGSPTTGGGCGISQAKGSTQIQQCSNQVLAALDALAAQVGQQPYQQIIDAAQALVNSLSNTQYFYQPKHGSDFDILNSAKAAAQTKLQHIIDLANGAANNPAGTVVGQSGQIISSGGNTITTGLDSISGLLNSPLVIYGALGLIGYVVIKKATK
jgi:hypothetical protein